MKIKPYYKDERKNFQLSGLSIILGEILHPSS